MAAAPLARLERAKTVSDYCCTALLLLLLRLADLASPVSRRHNYFFYVICLTKQPIATFVNDDRIIVGKHIVAGVSSIRKS